MRGPAFGPFQVLPLGRRWPVATVCLLMVLGCSEPTPPLLSTRQTLQTPIRVPPAANPAARLSGAATDTEAQAAEVAIEQAIRKLENGTKLFAYDDGTDGSAPDLAALAAEEQEDAAKSAEIRRHAQQQAKLGSACLSGHGFSGGWNYDVSVGLPLHVGGCVVDRFTGIHNEAIFAFARRHGPLLNGSIAALRHLRRAPRLKAGHYDWAGVRAEVVQEATTRLTLAVSDGWRVCGPRQHWLGQNEAEFGTFRFSSTKMRIAKSRRMTYIDAGTDIIAIAPSGYVTIHSRSAMRDARQDLDDARRRGQEPQ